MVFPLAANQSAELAEQVFISAIVSTLVLPAVLVFPSVFPVIANDEKASTALVSSLFSLGLSALLGALLFCVVFPQSIALVISGACMLLTQGLNIMLNGWITRENKVELIERARFAFGVTSVVSVYFVCFVVRMNDGLIWAASVSFLASSFVIWIQERKQILRLVRSSNPVSLAAIRRFAMDSIFVSTDSLVNNVAAQTPAFLIPSLGSFSAAWAVAARITGGFSTVLIQLVNPRLEAPFAEAVRLHEFARAKKVFSRARNVAAIAAVITVLSILATDFALGILLVRSDSISFILVIALIFVWGAQVANTATSRYLIFLGNKRYQYIATAFRASSALLLVIPGLDLAVLLMSLVAISLSHLLLTWGFVRLSFTSSERHN
jgi:hypothetical protein